MKKIKNNLVSQYLENISRKALEKYQDIIKKYVRERHGVYALYKKNKLYYIGLATNLRNRLSHHLHDRHKNAWDSFSIYLTVGDEHLKELETLLLRIIDKKGNRKRGKFGKAEDLRKKVLNDFKKALTLELSEIFPVTRTQVKRKIKVFTKKGRVPSLSPYINKSFNIRFEYKDKVFMARVRKDGKIIFSRKSSDYERLKGITFNSPSLAAGKALNRNSSGWTVWKYERAPGDWVLLNELRK